MREVESVSSGPFRTPELECRECGRPPHGGYCYPFWDTLTVVLVSVLVLFVVVSIFVMVASGT